MNGYFQFNLFLFIFSIGFVHANQSKPNVIFVYTDDQGSVDAGCYGAKDLYTPTIDRLFDRGFIGFTIDGKLLVSNKLTENERLRLGLRTDTNVGSFTNAQEVYLQYHRLKIFKG